MTVIEALAQLAVAERALLDELRATFPVGSTLTLDIGTPLAAHQVRGQVLGPVTEIGVYQQLALAVQLGGQSPEHLWPLGIVLSERAQAVGE